MHHPRNLCLLNVNLESGPSEISPRRGIGAAMGSTEGTGSGGEWGGEGGFMKGSVGTREGRAPGRAGRGPGRGGRRGGQPGRSNRRRVGNSGECAVALIRIARG
jgi:hypothetical protein